MLVIQSVEQTPKGIMKNDHLNTFVPYQSKELGHEDQLTRILLVLVKSSKVIETMFLDLIRCSMHEHGIKELPPNPFDPASGILSVETQVHSKTKNSLESETGRVVSIVITDERLNIDYTITRTDRNAVYDAYLKCKPDWVFVVENKPNNDKIWVEQLSSSFNENLEIEQIPVVITWDRIINRFHNLQETGLLSDGTNSMVDDFLEYIDAYYPELNPYHTFAACKGGKALLEKRCRAIMEASRLGAVKHHRGWHDYIDLSDKLDVKGIKMATLFPEVTSANDWKIILALYPGAIMSHARTLHENVSIDRVNLLCEKGWNIKSDMHLAFRSSGLYWMEHKPTIEAYLMWFKQNKISQVERCNLKKTANEWKKNGIISEYDLNEILKLVEEKGYSKYNVCPGLEVSFEWQSEEAINLDMLGSEKFKDELKDRVIEAISAWENLNLCSTTE